MLDKEIIIITTIADFDFKFKFYFCFNSLTKKKLTYTILELKFA